MFHLDCSSNKRKQTNETHIIASMVPNLKGCHDFINSNQTTNIKGQSKEKKNHKELILRCIE